VKHRLIRLHFLVLADVEHDLGGQVGAFFVVDLPVNDLAAEDVQRRGAGSDTVLNGKFFC